MSHGSEAFVRLSSLLCSLGYKSPACSADLERLVLELRRNNPYGKSLTISIRNT